jgi:hydroxyethylthiazole kinase-like uncharacterized protein yjeF
MSYAPVYLSSEIREIEAAAQRAAPRPTLMERAGKAAATRAMAIMPQQARAILVIAGPGNNGGDAFEVAALLKQSFHRVDVFFLGDRAKFSADSRAALGKWQNAGGRLLARLPGNPAQYGLIVDGLFGIGLGRALEGPYAAAVEWMNASAVPVLALDVPSGVNADTGAIMGVAVRAAHTVTFISLKPGLLTLDGPDCCGAVHIETLGLQVDSLRDARGHVLDAQSVRAALAPRPRNFHKGIAGNVAVLGGAAGMVGAALLTGRAALACGAGRVYAGLMDAEALPVDPLQPELMLRPAVEIDLQGAVVAAGPGMGRTDAARKLLAHALDANGPLVLDADALNLIGSDAGLAASVSSRNAPTLMTPHPAEAARLLQRKTADVQADRVAATLAIASQYCARVALKGNGTVVANPEGRWWINPTGHPGMASAGMGDALTGIVAALLAQGAQPEAALCAAVWLHGAAGDEVARQRGSLGTTASEVIAQARVILNAEIERRAD